MTSVMHDIFLLYTLFVHPLYFMKLTKISKCVNILFPLLGIPKKLFFYLSNIHCVPTMEHMHGRQHRVQDILSPEERAELSMVLLLGEFNGGSPTAKLH